MANTTKDLNRTLKKGDLMSIAVGQIIGAGVMVMSIAALGMTGRSVNIAFVVAAVLTCFGRCRRYLWVLQFVLWAVHIHRRQFL